MSYNLLTQRLLEQGFSVQSYPDYVRLPGSFNNSLNNQEGGFVYTQEYLKKMVFKTGCGLCVKGDNESIIREMYLEGKCYDAENDEIIVTCPYKKNKCSQSGLEEPDFCFCVCRRVEETKYIYENSLEKIQRQCEVQKTKAFRDFAERDGWACMIQSHYNENLKEWQEDFNAYRCVECINMSNCKYCNLLGRTLCEEKGNVMYELRETWTSKNGENMEYIEERLLFDQSISLDLCELALKYQEKPLLHRLSQSVDSIMYERRHPDYELTVQNMQLISGGRKIKKRKKRMKLKEREKLHQE